MSAARPAIAGATLAVAVALAGCQSENAPTARSVQALSPQLVSLMTEKGMSPRSPILMRIFKEDSKVEIWKKRSADGRYALLKSYDICRFSGKLGPKIKEGDKQAPEGFYSVTPAQMNPRSNYYLSFNIGYPNAYDRSLGRSGQHVMMHGDCLSAGCYAMTDAQMGEIYAMARESFAGGQKEFQVQALPFRMTAQNMARRRNNTNFAFWKNLKQGSDNFEVTKTEPKVDVCGKKYVFNATAGGISSFEPSAQCPSYQVQPEIAKAVAAKEKADNILIAQLSKSEPVADEYVAQNGRLRRTLDQPIVMVAQAPASPAAMTSGANAVTTPVAGPTLASADVAVKPVPTPPAKGGAATTTVALKTPVVTDAPTSDGKADGGFFSRMFHSNGEEPAAVAKAAPAARPAALTPTVVASAKPTAPAKPGATHAVAEEQTPVMASAVVASPAKPSGFSGWLKNSVGGLFGSKDEQPEAQPVEATPAVAPVTPAPGKAKNRQASIPAPLFVQKRADAGQRVAAAFAEAE